MLIHKKEPDLISLITFNIPITVGAAKACIDRLSGFNNINILYILPCRDWLKKATETGLHKLNQQEDMQSIACIFNDIKTVCRPSICNHAAIVRLIAYRSILVRLAIIFSRSASHSEERKVQALYILVVGKNPPKPPEKPKTVKSKSRKE